MNKLKAKLNAGQYVFGTHVTLTDPTICDMLGRLGFDYVWIDMEHSYLSFENVLSHLIALSGQGVPAVVRVPRDDYTFIKKVLEMGPAGIVFPMVTDATQVSRLIDATLYPPDGARGFGPMRAISYGMDDAKEYIKERSKELCRFVQIETRECIENMDEILKNPWVDGFVFGPFDLSGQLGQLGEIDTPVMSTIIRETAAKIKRAGKIAGFSIGTSDVKTLAYVRSLGITMLSAGADYSAAWHASRNTLENIRQVYEYVGQEAIL